MSSIRMFRTLLIALLTLAIGISWAKENETKEVHTYNLTTATASKTSLDSLEIKPESEKQDSQKSLVLALQLGGVFTILAWATIKSLHTRQKKYIFFAITIFFAIIRLLLTQPNDLIGVSLSAEQIYTLNPFLNLGTMINGLYTAHLATSTQETQEKRKYFIYTAYAAAFIAAISSLVIPRPLFIGIALTILIPFVSLVIYDLIYSVKQNKDGKQVLVLLVLTIGVIASTLSLNLFSYIQTSMAGAEGYQPFNPGLFVFILCGVLFIYMITVLEQRASDKNTLDTSNALKVAADESALRQNQQRFLSMLMHEIRTPLSVIKIGADAITKPNHPNDPPSIWTQRIDTAIDNIAQVIDNCVQAEKQESGLIQPTIQKHQLKNELENLHKEYLSVNSELESRIKFDIEIKNDASVITDINYLRSILLNLISNAYKYSEPFSTIHVRVLYEHKHTNNKILFQVENSLGKVESPDPDQLFQRYYRSESAKKFAGTGLGLWLSQMLANQIGSRIEMKTTEQQTILFFFSLQATN
jgi:signal transduction histidine kinase